MAKRSKQHGKMKSALATLGYTIGSLIAIVFEAAVIALLTVCIGWCFIEMLLSKGIGL